MARKPPRRPQIGASSFDQEKVEEIVDQSYVETSSDGRYSSEDDRLFIVQDENRIHRKGLSDSQKSVEDNSSAKIVPSDSYPDEMSSQHTGSYIETGRVHQSYDDYIASQRQGIYGPRQPDSSVVDAALESDAKYFTAESFGTGLIPRVDFPETSGGTQPLVSPEDVTGSMDEARFVDPLTQTEKHPENVIDFPEGTDFSSPKPAQKKQKIKKKWSPFKSSFTIFSIVSGVFIFAFLGICIFTPFLALKTINVTGTDLLDDNVVDNALYELYDRPLTQITDQDVEDRLANIVEIKDVQIERNPLHEMTVRIKERVPVAVIDEKNKTSILDSEGIQMGSAQKDLPSDLPRVDASTAKAGQSVLESIAEVLGTLPENILKDTQTVRAKSPSAVELVLKDGKVVVWGDASNSQLKARDLKTLLKDPRVKKEVKTIDVSAPGTPVTRN